jgi:ring-1,2-phenylacetyl-CoA epoxidase subunit PaaE
MPAFHDLVVSSVDSITDDSAAITLEVPPELADAYEFTPGQHLTFRLQHEGAEIRRTFSIFTTPASGELRVAVKLLPDGVFSHLVAHRLVPGERLSVMTPAGRFGRRALSDTVVPSRPASHQTYAAICAGSGITPILSIMTATLENTDHSFVLVYGNRRASSVMFVEEIADLKDRFRGRLTIYHILSQESHEAPVLSGRIDAAKLDTLLRLHPPESIAEWLLCGPAGLIELATAVLGAAGVGRAQLQTELFFTGPAVPVRRAEPNSHSTSPPGVQRVTVRLDGRTTTFDMPPTGSILDAVLAARPDAPYACKGGVCGTCRVRLVAGVVQMTRNFALDPPDLDAGFRLACQSVPASEEVTIDFDA